MKALAIAILLLTAALFIGCGQQPQEPDGGTLVGIVTDISPVWTGCGDGGITVDTTYVSIVGVNNRRPATKMELKVESVGDLKGHRVQVTGVTENGHFIARIIREL